MSKPENVEQTISETTQKRGRGWRRVWAPAIVATCALLMPVAARAQIAVVLRNLPPHAVQHSPLSVDAEVTSDAEIVSVRAQVDSAIVELALESTDFFGVTRWRGNVPLTGTYGTRVLRVTATDVNGAQATASASFPYYPEPPPDSSALTVYSPSPGDVARPTIEVGASFSGPNPEQVILEIVYVPAPRDTVNMSVDQLLPVFGSGTGGLSGVVDLSAFDPSSGNLVFRATVFGGLIAEVWVPIEVRSGPDPVDAGAEGDAGDLDAGLADAAVASDAATDYDAAMPDAEASDAEVSDAGEPWSDAGEPWSDAGEVNDDAGACSTDAGTTHGWPHGGTNHHHRRWIEWLRHFNCSASPQAPGATGALPGVLTGLLVLALVTRRRRARTA